MGANAKTVKDAKDAKLAKAAKVAKAAKLAKAAKTAMDAKLAKAAKDTKDALAAADDEANKPQDLNAKPATVVKTPVTKETKTKTVKKAGSGASGLLLGAAIVSMAISLM